MVARYDNAAVAILLCVSFFLSDLRFTPSLSFEATSDRVPFSMGRTCVVMEIPALRSKWRCAPLEPLFILPIPAQPLGLRTSKLLRAEPRRLTA